MAVCKKVKRNFLEAPRGETPSYGDVLKLSLGSSLFLLRRVYRFTKEKRLAKDCSQRGSRKSTTRPRKKWNFSLTRTRLFFSPACSVERCRRHLFVPSSCSMLLSLSTVNRWRAESETKADILGNWENYKRRVPLFSRCLRSSNSVAILSRTYSSYKDLREIFERKTRRLGAFVLRPERQEFPREKSPWWDGASLYWCCSF